MFIWGNSYTPPPTHSAPAAAAAAGLAYVINGSAAAVLTSGRSACRYARHLVVAAQVEFESKS